MNEPLVSICIPTKNRQDALSVCLHSITGNKAYDPSIVEVVVSDNASTDDTQRFMEEYVAAHPEIIYNRNPENIGAGGGGNFLKALSLAHGCFLKLCNDYSVFTEHGLAFLIETVRRYKELRPSLYFAQYGKTPSYSEPLSLNDLLLDQKWNMSWMGTNGYWKEQFDALENKEQSLPTRFMQIDWQLRSSMRDKGFVICRYAMTHRIPTKAKQGDYNFIEVHTTNFLGIFEPYAEAGEISRETMTAVRKDLLYNMVEWIVRLGIANKGRYSYTSEGAYAILEKNFGAYDWYKPLLKQYKRRAFRKVVRQDIIRPFVYPLAHKILQLIRKHV